MAQEVNFSVDVDGLSVTGRLHRPSEANGKVPACVLICRAAHDATESENDLLAAVEHGLTAGGIAVATFDPRIRLGESDDATPPPTPDHVKRAAAVFDWLTRRIDLDGLRLSVLGHGVGAIVAAGLAHQVEQVHRLGLISPVAPERLQAYLASRGSAAGNSLDPSMQALTSVPVAKPLLSNRRQALIVLGATERAQHPESGRMYEQVAASAPRNTELVLVPFADASFSTPTARQVCVERIVDFFSAKAPAATPAR